MNRVWFDVQSLAVNAIHNWEQVRLYHSSTIERRPGFTESWGQTKQQQQQQQSSTNEEPSKAERPPLGWSICKEIVTSNRTSTFPTVVVVQFQPAWAVQLALRSAGVEHCVVNSSYAVTEATGPLPYLQTDSALVGGSSQNILKYLTDTKQVTLTTTSQTLLENGTTLVSMDLLEELITETLADVLSVLRYKDNHAWKATERPKGMKAVRGNWFMGHWHVWAERHVAMGAIDKKRISTVEQAKNKAIRAYAILEKTMLASPEIFLSRNGFSLAGLALFEHFMHALADAHLVTILHHYPAMCRYGQAVWQEYFGPTSTIALRAKEENQNVNAANPFFILPTEDTWKSLPTTKDDDGLWQARFTALAREAAISVKPRATTVPVTVSEETKPHTESSAEAAVAAYQTADQRWMASVLLVAIVAIARTVGQAGNRGAEAE